MDDHRDRIDALDERTAELLADSAKRQASSWLTEEPTPVWQCKRVGTMSSPEYSAWCDAGKPPLEPKTALRARPANPGMTRRDIEIMLGAVGDALGTVRAELRAEYKHQLAELEARIDELERGRRGPKVLDARVVFGKGRAA